MHKKKIFYIKINLVWYDLIMTFNQSLTVRCAKDDITNLNLGFFCFHFEVETFFNYFKFDMDIFEFHERTISIYLVYILIEIINLSLYYIVL